MKDETREYNDAEWPDKLAFEFGREGFKSIVVTASKDEHEVRMLTAFDPATTDEILVKLVKLLAMVSKGHPSMRSGAFLVSGGKDLDHFVSSMLSRLVNDDNLYVVYLDKGSAVTVCVRGEPFAVTHIAARAAAMIEKSYGCKFMPPPSRN